MFKIKEENKTLPFEFFNINDAVNKANELWLSKNKQIEITVINNENNSPAAIFSRDYC